MAPLFLTHDLVHRLDKVEFDCTRRRMEAIGRIAGAGVGMEYPGEGGVFALKSRIPNPYFNRVLGRLADQPDLVEALARRYLADEAPVSFEVSPGCLDRRVADLLADLGFRQTQFHPILLAAAPSLAVPPPGHPVEVVTGGPALAAFADVYVDGWDVSSGFAPTMKTYIGEWAQTPEWTLYLARVGGQPAAVGVLHRSDDGIAYLADAATAKALRGMGGQHAVLAARLAASHVGCQVVMSRADFGSTSQRNLERLGLHVAYTRAVWTR